MLLAARGDALDDLLAIASRGPRRRPARRRPAGRHHVLEEGLHPADPAVPGPLPLLHVRHRAAPAAGATFLERDEVLDDRPRGRRAGLQGGPVHPRRPAGGALAGGAASGWTSAATTPPWTTCAPARSRCWRRPGLLPHLNPGVLSWAELPAAQAGRAEHGHDAGDHRDPAVVRAGRPALRLAGQGAGGPAAGARGRRPGRRAVHHRHPDRHRRDPRRARRVAVRDPRARPASTATSRR